MIVDRDGDRATIADMERFGVRPYLVTMLENADLIYVDQLQGLTADDLRRQCRSMGPVHLSRLIAALGQFLKQCEVVP